MTVCDVARSHARTHDTNETKQFPSMPLSAKGFPKPPIVETSVRTHLGKWLRYRKRQRKQTIKYLKDIITPITCHRSFTMHIAHLLKPIEHSQDVLRIHHSYVRAIRQTSNRVNGP